MHTLDCKTHYVLHNSDFSGDLKIHSTISGDWVHAPYEVFEAVVAKKLRDEAITRIENMDDDAIIREFGSDYVR